MFVGFSVSAIDLSDNGQDFLGLKVVDDHGLILYSLDRQVFYFEFYRFSFEILNNKYYIARPRRVGNEMFSIRYVSSLSVLFYLHFHETRSVFKGDAFEQVHFLVNLQVQLGDGFQAGNQIQHLHLERRVA